MPITHTNRRGKTYYLRSKPDKKGRLRFFFSTKEEDGIVQAIPDGHEIYENVNGQVFLRRKAAQKITDEELKTVFTVLRKHEPAEWRYTAEINKNTIIIHEACEKFDTLSAIIPFGRMMSEDFKKRRSTYMPVMRFTLVDESERLFQPERMCFRGEDHWIDIGAAGVLAFVACKYIRYLGTEEIYELY